MRDYYYGTGDTFEDCGLAIPSGGYGWIEPMSEEEMLQWERECNRARLREMRGFVPLILPGQGRPIVEQGLLNRAIDKAPCSATGGFG